MSAALAPVEGQNYDTERIALIRQMCAPDSTDVELQFFLYQCQRLRLDPLLKQVYFQKRGGKVGIQVGIDGLRLIADRTGLYAGSDEARFAYGEDKTYPARAIVTVHKIVGGEARPFVGVAHWREFAPYYNNKLGDMWQKMPHNQLAKCAEAQALRKAFPAELSGVYTDDEMEQSESDPPEDRPVPRPKPPSPTKPQPAALPPPQAKAAPESKEASPEEMEAQAKKVDQAKNISPEVQDAAAEFKRTSIALGMSYTALETRTRQEWIARLLGEEEPVNFIALTAVDWKKAGAPLRGYMRACETMERPDLQKPENILELCKEVLHRLPANLFSLSRREWAKLCSHIEVGGVSAPPSPAEAIEPEAKPPNPQGRFYALWAEAGLPDPQTHADFQREWMGKMLSVKDKATVKLDSRSVLTPADYRYLCDALEMEANTLLADAAQSEEEEAIPA